MRAFALRAALVGLGLVALASSAAAEPKHKKRVVERVVALVDGRPVWQSELATALRPFEKMLQAQRLKALEAARAKSELTKQVLERLIDRRLVAADAERAKLTVSDAELDAAIDKIAKANQIATAAIYAEAKAQGMNQAAYRAEVAAQILEAKMLQLWMARRSLTMPKGGDREVQAAMQSYAERWRGELRKAAHVEQRLKP